MSGFRHYLYVAAMSPNYIAYDRQPQSRGAFLVMGEKRGIHLILDCLAHAGAVVSHDAFVLGILPIEVGGRFSHLDTQNGIGVVGFLSFKCFTCVTY